ncbi:MAG: molybdopterin-binding protein [Haloarcula sp.]
MVDFQSRDTRRGPSDDESDGEGDGMTEADSDEETGPESQMDETNSTESNAKEPDESERESDTAGSGAETSPEEDVKEQAGSTAQMTGEGDTRGETVEPTTHSADADPLADPQSRTREPTESDAQPATDEQSGHPVPDRGPSVDVAVVTVGTATDGEGDPTGTEVEAALDSVGHTVTARERLRDDYDGIQQAVDRLVGREDVDVVVTAGGIGITPSENTLEAVHPLFEKALPGFEEVYRSLLFEQRGTGVIAVRATAGIANETPVFCLPADPDAARLAVVEIIAAEASNLVTELS